MNLNHEVEDHWDEDHWDKFEDLTDLTDLTDLEEVFCPSCNGWGEDSRNQICLTCKGEGLIQ